MTLAPEGIISSHSSGMTEVGKGCYAEAYNKASSRHEKRLLTSAYSALKTDFRSWRREESLKPYWLESSPAPTRKELAWSGGGKAVLGLIGQGVFEADCGVWTGDFWAGLRDSGVLRQKKSGRSPWTWRAKLKGLPDLAADLAQAQEVLIKVSRQEDSKGRKMVRSVSSLFPDPQASSPGWLAGVLSGMTLETRLGKWVLESGRVRPRVLEWLKEAGVWHCGSMKGGIWVSPFYLPLVAKYGPPRSMGRWETIRREGWDDILAGEWLPLATWEVVFGHEVAGKWPSRAWSLPWAIGHATRARHGIDREKAHLAAVQRGIGTPAVWLKCVCSEWRERNEDEKRKS